MRPLLYSLLAFGLFGADWPQLRGPNGSGLCPSCGQLPTGFGPQKNVLWKTELPEGKSSPVLVGDRIFLTASEGDDLITMCLSRATGKVQWRRSVRATDTDAYIIAVDADSGMIAWKTPRDVINGYSTPIIYRPALGPAQIIAPGSYQLTAYSIVNGETLWFVRGLTCQPKSAPTIA